MNILRDINRIARKEHRCNYCNGIIQIGEKYNCQTNVYDGDIYTWKAHLRCQDIALELNMFDDCDEGVTTNDFMEIITEAYYQIQPGPEPIPDFHTRLDCVCDHYLITNQ